MLVLPKFTTLAHWKFLFTSLKLGKMGPWRSVSLTEVEGITDRTEAFFVVEKKTTRAKPPCIWKAHFLGGWNKLEVHV